MIPPLAVLALTLAGGLLLRRYLFRAARGWAARNRSRSAQLLIEATRVPFLAWVLILALHLAMESSPLPRRASTFGGNLLLVLWILSLTDVFSRLAARLVQTWGSYRSDAALPVSTLSQNLARLVVIIVGVLILLNSIGISVTPILTALGVGGLAVALALQDTLSNLFAGVYISVANQIRIGDYIKLQGGGEEGYVSDIGWRSTAVRTLGNNLVIVPNSKLAQTIVTNYHLPERRMGLTLNVLVSYQNDPDDIEAILLDEANKAVGQVKGLRTEPGPSVRLIPGFTDFGINYSLNYQIDEFVDQYLVQHELRKRIYRRFRQAGIEIPLPSRTVYLRTDPDGEHHADRLASGRREQEH